MPPSLQSGIFNTDCLVIPKGAKNVALSQKAIALMLSPDLQANIPAYIDYGPTNRRLRHRQNLGEQAVNINSSPVNAASRPT